ncbi:uncharacterized protein LOC130506077 [Raphanus sativus]|uniref:Uncharacterized protein LOC130506077 n=1 Tax=Raphanus sativus TaxID=3726 RepID=A0A9W3CYJ6_RAPSA|nr:uncharacterized protein LOC130506077 [Raphanus sativus]
METSPKVKHFLWRCLNNALPVALNMVHRHIAKQKMCSRCGDEEESVNHLLFKCHYARLVWALANVHIPPAGVWSDSLYANIHWVLNLKKEYPMEEVEESFAPWLMWRLWKNRNDFVFRGNDHDAALTVWKVWEDVFEWISRAEVKEKEVKEPTAPKPEVKWKPPAERYLKCNSDAAWLKEERSGGAGWILRDHRGRLIWAGAKKLAEVRSAIEAEAEAVRWALQTVTGFGYDRVQFETDSLQLMRMINGEEETWPLLEPIIQEIAALMSMREEITVVYYPRSGNKTADRIARETSTFTSFVPKLYSMSPTWLSSCLESDKLVVRT